MNITVIGVGFPLLLGLFGGKPGWLGGFVMSALVVPLCIFVVLRGWWSSPERVVFVD